jgi:general stress protein 26
MSAENDVKKLAELIKGIKVVMLTTVCADGSLRSRPMVTQDKEFDGTLWFFTPAESPKVSEVEHEQRVNVSYADHDKERYVSVSGTARLVRDRDTIKEFWGPALRAWFPKGPDDPELALLRVEVEKAEFWDGPSSAVVHLVGFVKAMVTGQLHRPGTNEKVDLRERAAP